MIEGKKMEVLEDKVAENVKDVGGVVCMWQTNSASESSWEPVLA